MTYWVEVHCDVRSEAPRPGFYGINCETLAANNPGQGGRSAVGAVKAAEKLARAKGWKRRHIAAPRYGEPRIGWACPHCLKHPEPDVHA